MTCNSMISLPNPLKGQELGSMSNELPKEWEEFGEIPIGIPLMTATRLQDFLEGLSSCLYKSARKRIDPEMSFTHWSYNIRGQSTDTRPTNITEGAD